MAPRPHARSKVLDASRLLDRVEKERERGGRIVFTNGCFDLLHAGHLYLLESAAELGDRLVVALNDDGSVRRLKGAGRPFVPFRERSALVAGLEAVAWVVGFGEPTPLALIERLRPDVLVKGGDWPIGQIIGREVVEGYGGRVVSLPRLPGASTTLLERRIRGGGSTGREVRPGRRPLPDLHREG